MDLPPEAEAEAEAEPDFFVGLARSIFPYFPSDETL
jgi:hypothetical protein